MPQASYFSRHWLQPQLSILPFSSHGYILLTHCYFPSMTNLQLNNNRAEAHLILNNKKLVPNISQCVTWWQSFIVSCRRFTRQYTPFLLCLCMHMQVFVCSKASCPAFLCVCESDVTRRWWHPGLVIEQGHCSFVAIVIYWLTRQRGTSSRGQGGNEAN